MVLGAGPVRADAVINVPADVATIQGAIDAATSGDTVVVAPGTYFEHLDFKGKAIEVRSSAGPAGTIIDGSGTSVVAIFGSGETRASVLRGFTITHGLLPRQGLALIAGGGIAIAGSSPTIVGNVITGNDAGTGAGGGIGVADGAPLIAGNDITANRAAAGGGVIAGRGAEVVGNRIQGNTADGGGGLVLYGGPATVRDNVIRGNHAGNQDGGGVAIIGAGALLSGNLIADNTADVRGGGVFWDETGSTDRPYLLNNTIVSNLAPAGSALAGQSDGLRVVNNVIVGPAGAPLVDCRTNAPEATLFSHNDVYNGTPARFAGCPDPTGTGGNIAADPRFAALPPSPWEYRPGPGSPAIDAGDSAAPSLPPTDLAGSPRVADGDGDGQAKVDMGAYETEGPARFHPLAPARILDTRLGLGAPALKPGPGSTLELQVSGQGGVPASGVSAVVLNVTAVDATATSFLTAWPAGSTRPVASNLNYVPARPSPTWWWSRWVRAARSTSTTTPARPT